VATSLIVSWVIVNSTLDLKAQVSQRATESFFTVFDIIIDLGLKKYFKMRKLHPLMNSGHITQTTGSNMNRFRKIGWGPEGQCYFPSPYIKLNISFLDSNIRRSFFLPIWQVGVVES
jgi:hypothetical protein